MSEATVITPAVAPVPDLLVTRWWLASFASASAAAGLGRAVTTSYLPLLLERIRDAPSLIGAAMLVNAAAGFAVPLAVGVWADRARRRGEGIALRIIVAGSWLTAGGLAAIALGAASSYLILALLALLTYAGLNAVATAHRALVREAFAPARWARATSVQELALLVGGLVGVAAGGALFALAPWAPFALAALAVVALARPTTRTIREPRLQAGDTASSRAAPSAYLLSVAAHPGVRGFLAAEVLWVLGYAALPTFFLLYAEEVLDVSPARAAAWLAAFGITTGLAVLAAGRAKDRALYRPLLVTGLVLMGVGFAAMALAGSLLTLTPPLLAAAAGFGIVSTTGYAAFAALVPEAEAGAYTAVFLAARAIGSALALPLVGLLIELSGSYRTLFLFGAAATLVSLVPLLLAGGANGEPRARRRPRRKRRLASPALRRAAARLALGWLAVVALGLLVLHTPLKDLDGWLFRAVNGLGYGPDLLFETLNPHTRNYALLVAVGAALALPRGLGRAASFVAASVSAALVAFVLLEAAAKLLDRPRPEETFGSVTLHGNSWSHLESYPSGHMAVTAALGASVALAYPRLRLAAWAYVCAIGFSRVLFGAHFPTDVIAGTVLGAMSASVVFRPARAVASRLLRRRGLRSELA